MFDSSMLHRRHNVTKSKLLFPPVFKHSRRKFFGTLAETIFSQFLKQVRWRFIKYFTHLSR